MTLPPGWESFWQPAIRDVQRERLAYRKLGTDIVVEPAFRTGFVVRRDGKMPRVFLWLPEAIEWADKQEAKT